MKIVLLTLMTAIIIFGSFSCRKPKPYTISGHIYERCGVPAGNKTFSFYQSGGGGGTLGMATTDASGRFSVSLVPLNDAYIQVGIPLNVGYSTYGQFYPKGDVTDMNIPLYNQPTTYLKVSMQVYNNTYTDQDTLYIVDYRRTTPPYQIAIPGPFSSKLLYSVPNYGILNYVYSNTLAAWGYKINNRDYSVKTDTLKACDTTRFTVDIR